MNKNLRKRFSGALKAIPVITSLILASSANSQCSTTISIDSTLSCFGDTTAALSLVPNVPGSPIMISEANRNSPDLIEIHNVTGAALDVTGYYVATSDSYTDINIPNSLTWNLTGVVAAGWVGYRDDAGGANNWGNNLFYNGTDAGWIAICDASHNVVDIFFWEWSAADIATFAPVVGGNTLILDPSQWVGNGLTGGCGAASMTRSTNIENNDATDWTCGAAPSAGVSNMTVTPISAAMIVSTTWSTGETTATIDDLGAGTYYVTVLDDQGCTSSDTVTIADPAQLIGTATVTDVLCFGDSNGAATLVTTGGTGPITTDWGTNNPTMLATGYSSYSLMDSLGCSFSDSVLVNEPTILDLTLTGQSIPCFGDSMGGSADAVVSGGTPGYNYNWSNAATTSSVSGLSAGWYTVDITDSNGCVIMDSVEITEPTMLTISGVTTDEISGNDGSIDLTVSGGTLSYSFVWTNGAPAVEDPTGLAGGSYDVTVTDGNGCIITGTYVVNSQVGIDELNELQFNVTPNPNNGNFKLSINPKVGAADIQIWNSLGQVIYSDEVSSSEKNISLESIDAGVYFVHVFNSTSRNIVRIVVR